MPTNTHSITDYLQNIRDIIPAIQMGIVPSEIGVVYHKFGGAFIGTTQSIVSTCSNENPFNTNALPLYASSDNANDTQQIRIEGVDQDFNVKLETVTLQGQTAVPLQTIFRTVYRAYNFSDTDLAGDVYIGSESTPTNGVPTVNNQYAVINGEINDKLVNQTLTSIFTIPAGYTGFITNWYVTSDKNSDIDFTAYKRNFGKVWRYGDRMQVFEASQNKILPYIKCEEKSDLKVMGTSENPNSNGSVTYDLVLINNSYLQKMRRLAWR